MYTHHHHHHHRNASDKVLKKMSTVATELLLHHRIHRNSLRPIPKIIPKRSPPFHLICAKTPDCRLVGTSLSFRNIKPLSATGAAVVETSESPSITFSETFKLERLEKVMYLFYVNNVRWETRVIFTFVL